MVHVSLDIDPDKFRATLRGLIEKGDMRPAVTLVSDALAEELRRQLAEQVQSGEVRRFKVEPVTYRTFGSARFPRCLAELTRERLIPLGAFTLTVVTHPENPPEIDLLSPMYVNYGSRSYIKRYPTKRIAKCVIRLYEVSLQTRVFQPLYEELAQPSCLCPPQYLVPHIDGVWDWAVIFICLVCGKSYLCECFRAALDKRLAKALSVRSLYGPEGWPHRFVAKYERSEFREAICHLCRNKPSDLFYCHPMYGSKVEVAYGPYIVRTVIEKGIDGREAENEVRDLLGIPRVGEGWLSEMELLGMVRRILPDEEVLHQASPEWLAPQRLDIYVPSMRVAIEYQGRQHYEAVPFLGGDEGFQRTKERDSRKTKLCAENGVRLIRFRYDERLTPTYVERQIRSAQVQPTDD